MKISQRIYYKQKKLEGEIDMVKELSWVKAVFSNTKSRDNSNRNLLVIIGLVLYSWALVIPYGGVADEPTYYHYGANSFNELFQIREIKNEYQLTKPEDVLKNIDKPCFAFNPQVSSNCGLMPNIDVLVSSNPRLVDYPKFFFLFTIWPLFLFPSAFGFLLAKLIAVSISIFIIGIAISTWQKNRRVLSILVLACLNPLAMHIMAGYNPNAFEISGGLALCIVLFGRPTTRVNQKFTFYFILTVIAVFTASAKPFSGVLVVGVYSIFLVFYWVNQRGSFLKILSSLKKETTIIFCALIISVIVSRQATEDSPVKATFDLSSIIKDSFFNIPESVVEYSGIFGWRESRSPIYLSLIWILLQSILALLAFKTSQQKVFVANAIVFVNVIFTAPVVANVALTSQYNVGLQMRYLLPLLFGLTALMVMQISSKYLIVASFITAALTLIGLLNLLLLNIRFSIGDLPDVSLTAKIQETYLDSSSWHPTYFKEGIVLLILATVAIIFYVTPKRKLRIALATIPLTLGALSLASLLYGININTLGSTSDSSLGQILRPNPVGPVSEGIVIEQTFVSKNQNLYAIELLAATYGRNNDAIYTYELFDDSDNLIFNTSQSSLDIKDNSWLKIEFPKITNSKGKTFRLRLLSKDATEGNSITFYYNLGSDLTPESFLEINNKRLDGDLILKLTSESQL